MLTLRPYQLTASDSVMQQWFSVNSTLLQLFTGGGKTVIFADLIRRIQPMPSIVLVHREELAWQAKERIEATTGLAAHIEMGQYRAPMNPQVVVATVQSLYARNGDRARMGRFNPKNFGALIADEFHHYAAPRYKDVIHYFRQNPDLRMLGCTATPKRHDGMELGSICESVAFQYVCRDGVSDGWLVDIRAKEVYVEGLDLSSVHTAHGDFVEAELARIMEEEKVLHGVASTTLQEIGTRRTIVYTVRVKQAELLAEIFNRHKPGSAFWICGETPREQRRDLLGAFKKGEYQIMCNVGIATEGFDDPGVSAVVMARPTLSPTLCEQMIGRGDRPAAGSVDGPDLDTPEKRKASIANSSKPNELVLDFSGNLGRHKPATAIDVLAGDDEAVKTRALKIAKSSKESVSVLAVIDKAKEELNREREREQHRKKMEAERRSRIRPTSTYSYKWVNVFSEDYAQYNGKKLSGQKQLTLNQYAYLKRNGVVPDHLPYWQALKKIEELHKRPATENQIWKLKSIGATPREGITVSEASKLIGQLTKGQNDRQGIR